MNYITDCRPSVIKSHEEAIRSLRLSLSTISIAIASHLPVQSLNFKIEDKVEFSNISFGVTPSQGGEPEAIVSILPHLLQIRPLLKC